METMNDFKEELEASLRKIRVGDIVSGTVIDVTDDAVLVDLKSYADGIIRKEDVSEDPDFNMKEMLNTENKIYVVCIKSQDFSIYMRAGICYSKYTFLIFTFIFFVLFHVSRFFWRFRNNPNYL